MPDPESLSSATPIQKDTSSSYVGAGVAEPSDYPYYSHEKTLKWINETKQKLPSATPQMREEAFRADPLLNGTIYPYLKNVLLQGFSIQTKDNKLYSEAIEEISDFLNSLELMKAFRDDFLDFAILCGHSYRRMDYDLEGKTVSRLEKIEPSSVETYIDPWDSSIIAYHQHARVNKSWSSSGTFEDIDSWFIPYTLRVPEIPFVIKDINSTYIDNRETGNDPNVFYMFTAYKTKYNISATSNLRIAAAERILAMHNSSKIQRHNSYYDESDYNHNPAPIDTVLLAIWLKRLLLVNAPNLRRTVSIVPGS